MEEATTASETTCKTVMSKIEVHDCDVGGQQGKEQRILYKLYFEKASVLLLSRSISARSSAVSAESPPLTNDYT
ncbi:hypothetical protein PC116_g1219 [Phytophthora cactorum]|uniref:Uncharacterized protein n=1 Tax=Phytophthora cactorum TaxID=29920 RepID=A0A8T1LTZ7_9STRA|nr:hypothetical protein PC111_g1217 [Phytophthora cactorum]KAG2868249.1 hypothetical protein PC113_g1214 [Phytophthora cactorum]KAG3184640.1 hypothetical protein PC128_g13650 [Phytophthora cactorum]KAG4251046.1 hypothetical protein PC116_g1219 [Phytophthora cactorum]